MMMAVLHCAFCNPTTGGQHEPTCPMANREPTVITDPPKQHYEPLYDELLKAQAELAACRKRVAELEAALQLIAEAHSSYGLAVIQAKARAALAQEPFEQVEDIMDEADYEG